MIEQTSTVLFPQETILHQLFARYAANELPPSLLFTGGKGTGKWSVAHELAKRITCLQPADGPCNTCSSCRQTDRFDHPDINYLFPLPKELKEWEKLYFPYLQAKQQSPFEDAPSSATQFIPIDAIRVFQNKLSLKPSLSAAKVGIIYEAERMLPGTMDSLLKLLEEPPPRTYLIVVTDQPRFLHATILSRLQRIPFPPLPEQFVALYLKDKLQVPVEKIPFLTRFTRGSLHNVEAIIEGGFIELRESAFSLYKSAIQLPAAELFVKAGDNEHLQSRGSVEKLLSHWQGFLRDLVIMNLSGDSDLKENTDLLLNPDFVPKYQELKAQLVNLSRVEKQNDKLEQVREELRRNVNPKMAALSFLTSLGEVTTGSLGEQSRN
jgi:DNA polymerase-3 subunit delta'